VFTSLWRRIRETRGRWWLRLAVLLIAGLALFVWFLRQRAQEPLTIENRSGQVISQLSVTRGDKTSHFRDVATGADMLAPLGASGDDPLKLEGRLAGGTRIMWSGMLKERAHLVVLPGGEVRVREEGKPSFR
jgi:hypothetical protein